EEDEVGVTHEAEGEVEAALLAAREVVPAVLSLAFEPDEADDVIDVHGLRIEAGEVGQGLFAQKVFDWAGGRGDVPRGAPPTGGGWGGVDAEHTGVARTP